MGSLSHNNVSLHVKKRFVVCVVSHGNILLKLELMSTSCHMLQSKHSWNMYNNTFLSCNMTLLYDTLRGNCCLYDLALTINYMYHKGLLSLYKLISLCHRLSD